MEKIFANGFMFKLPQGNAPEYVKGKVSIKVDEFISFLNEHKSDTGWVNIDVKQSAKGNVYGELNTWKGGKTEKKVEVEEIDTRDIPF